MSHTRGDRLTNLWDAVGKAWTAVVSGSQWVGGQPRKDGTRRMGDRELFGVAGWVRVVEVTHGVNGWHVHVHALLFLDTPTSDDGIRVLGQRMWGRWARSLRRSGYSSDLEHHGLDAKLIRGDAEPLAAYFTKNVYGGDVAAEMTMGPASKTPKNGNRTPWQILEGVVSTGDADDLDVWHEFEQGSLGRRMTTWSAGFRDVLGLGAEQDDQAIADERAGSDADPGFVLPNETWRAIWAADREFELIEVCEEQGVSAGLAWLERHGWEHRPLPPKGRPAGGCPEG